VSIRAVLLVTGSEVARGVIDDRNGPFLARSLETAGVDVVRIELLPDDLETIAGGVRRAVSDGVGLVVTTGGLGATHDDVTMAAVAAACGRALERREEVLALVSAAYARYGPRGVSATVNEAMTAKQATLPVGARMLPPIGIAPGCALACGETLVVVLPGPPAEAAGMWQAAAADDPVAGVLARAPRRTRRVLRIDGAVESQFVETLAGVAPAVLEPLDVVVCARDGELEVTIGAGEAGSAAAAEVEAALEDRFGDALYSRDGRTGVAVLSDLLRARGQTVSVAESSTGGGLGALLTALPGSSDIFPGGVIAYADAVKVALLGVPEAVLAAHGAVSPETARAMAAGVVATTGSDWGLSVTGVAGPGGGTPAKPVGLVFLGLHGPGGVSVVEELRGRGSRGQIRARAAARAVHLLRRALLEGV
jgi:nicotinamide-nucleotide amidase